MPNPHLVLSNYNDIVCALGVSWGDQRPNRPDLFCFNKTHRMGYSGPKIHQVLDTGMEALWISSGSKKREASTHLILADRSYSDWMKRTDVGAAYFINGVALDGGDGTSLIHPSRIRHDVFMQKQSGPDQFMEEATPELRDFFVKHILFNIGA
jgi:hypothetical protein